MSYQQNIFEEIYPRFRFSKPVRLIELFAGYGSQAFAMKYLNMNFEPWRICEWNYKSFHAYKCFHHNEDNTDYSEGMTDEELYSKISNYGISSNWNEPMTTAQIKALKPARLRQIYNDIQATHNLVDVSRVNARDLAIEREREREHDYVLTYSFPCQDLSLAGKMGGLTASRSGLLWQVERILKELTELKQRPDVLLMENVPQVHGEGNVKLFQDWLYALELMGYKSYIEDLSATDYGIPQTRVRAFMVSILGDYNYEFPQKKPLNLKLCDMLEDEAPRKYYLTSESVKRISHWKAQQKPLKKVKSNVELCPTITARGAGEDHSGMILIDEALFNKALKETLKNNVCTHGDFIDTYNKVIKKDGMCTTITTRINEGNHHYVAVDEADKTLSIRKLTPLECFRLMGVKDCDFDNIREEFSDSVLYHLAGDSIVVDVLMAIFEKMI